MRWYWWFLIVMAAGSLFVSADETNPIAYFAYTFPFNCALYILPTWLTVRAVKYFRRKPTPS